MAIVKKRGDTIYIQWFDPIRGKVQSKSTKLKYNPTNIKNAEGYAKKDGGQAV